MPIVKNKNILYQPSKNEIADCVRECNRFYTALFGFLSKNYLETGFSVTEASILFEINKNDAISAKALCEILKLDKGYMSRILRSFEKGGIIRRKASAIDKRANCISLTEAGKAKVMELIEITNRDIFNFVSSLDDETYRNICFSINFLMQK